MPSHAHTCPAALSSTTTPTSLPHPSTLAPLPALSRIAPVDALLLARKHPIRILCLNSFLAPSFLFLSVGTHFPSTLFRSASPPSPFSPSPSAPIIRRPLPLPCRATLLSPSSQPHSLFSAANTHTLSLQSFFSSFARLLRSLQTNPHFPYSTFSTSTPHSNNTLVHE